MMSAKQTVNRNTLMRVVNLVKPALATAAYIPALTHVKFDPEFATAYNDITAILVSFNLDLEACLPGELLGKALSSFSSDNLMLQQSGSDVVLSSGRSKIKLPYLDAEKFPFDFPELDGRHGIDIDAAMLRGIELCLTSVGNDPTHPAQMGVTLDADDKGRAILFSTDNFSISRYQTKTKIELPGDSPVIMPTFFCVQLVGMSKAFPDDAVTLYLAGGSLVAEFGKQKAYIINKVMVDLEPLVFPRIITKNVPDLAGLKERARVLPDNWDSSFQRALLVLGGEVDKVSKVKTDGESITIYTSSAMGEADDVMELKDTFDDFPDGPFYVDPALVVRASKPCALVEFRDKVMVMADSECQFLHLIAHCSK
jgi:hypothetical protein